jgi:hypothetical protein
MLIEVALGKVGLLAEFALVVRRIIVPVRVNAQFSVKAKALGAKRALVRLLAGVYSLVFAQIGAAEKALVTDRARLALFATMRSLQKQCCGAGPFFNAALRLQRSKTLRQLDHLCCANLFKLTFSTVLCLQTSKTYRYKI